MRLSHAGSYVRQLVFHDGNPCGTSERSWDVVDSLLDDGKDRVSTSFEAPYDPNLDQDRGPLNRLASEVETIGFESATKRVDGCHHHSQGVPQPLGGRLTDDPHLKRT